MFSQLKKINFVSFEFMHLNCLFRLDHNFSKLKMWSFRYQKVQIKCQNLPQEFSSDPSLQSFSPLQKSPRSIQFPSPHARKPSWQSGSSVIKSGLTFLSLLFNLQFLTAFFQSHVCFSISKYKPAGQRIAWRP